MKKMMLLLGLLLSFTSYASLITFDTSQWSVEQSPRDYAGARWHAVDGNQVIQSRNAYGSFISDFTTSGDFQYSGFMNPTIINSDDNDLLGVVFGWQDHDNHYRLGWEQGGYNDSSGASGLFLVKEVSGVSSILFQQEVFWDDNTQYDFNIERHNDDISFTLNGLNGSYTDTNFMTGHLGVYVEHQTATFGELSNKLPATLTVPEPSIFAIFALVMIGLVARRLKK